MPSVRCIGLAEILDTRCNKVLAMQNSIRSLAMMDNSRRVHRKEDSHTQDQSKE